MEDYQRRKGELESRKAENVEARGSEKMSNRDTCQMDVSPGPNYKVSFHLFAQARFSSLWQFALYYPQHND